MDISDNGVKFIASHEGFRAKAYNDVAGHATIGYGHLIHTGPLNGTEPAEFRGTITKARAEELLRGDVATAVAAVNNSVEVPLNQHQFDALVSFTFNLGGGNLARSDLLKRLNNGEYDAVPAELMRWTRAGGKVYQGLVNRRTQESALWTTGNYNLKATPGPTPPTTETTHERIGWLSQFDMFESSNRIEVDCLSADCAMVINAYGGINGRLVTVDDVTELMKPLPRPDEGFYIMDPVNRLNNVPGMPCEWYWRGNVTMGQLKVETDNFRPAILYITAKLLPPNWRYHGFSGLHFVLATAVTDVAIHYLDSNWQTEAQGRCWLPIDTFLPAWQHAGKTPFQALFVRRKG